VCSWLNPQDGLYLQERQKPNPPLADWLPFVPRPDDCKAAPCTNGSGQMFMAFISCGYKGIELRSLQRVAEHS